VIAYTTVHGLIVGWDLRAPRLAWKLQNKPKLGQFDVECFYISLLVFTPILKTRAISSS